MPGHAVDPSVLAHCVAIVVARSEQDGEALMRLGPRLRFGETLRYSPRLVRDPFSHRLVFFLVHFGFDDAARQHLLQTLRHSSSVSLSYAPVVLFLRDASVDQIRAGIEMGFDDVINVPAEGPEIATRLAAQIGREHLYVETRHYLGPDRHRLDHLSVAPQQRHPLEPHARLTILRTVENGVHIVRRQEVHPPH